MEIIIASIIGLLIAVATGGLVYGLMRQQTTTLRQQLDTANKTLQLEQTKLQETKLQLSQRELELKYEKEKNEESRKQADEKLAEQIRFF